jgi:ribosomal protein L7/L12
MTQEEKMMIAKIIRRETGCGLMTASKAVDNLIYALKCQPHIVLDNPYKLKMTWEQY